MDLNDFANKLNKIISDTPEISKTIASKIGNKVLAETKMIAPPKRRTGTLMRNWRLRVEPDGFKIVNSAEYAKWVNDGHRIVVWKKVKGSGLMTGRSYKAKRTVGYFKGYKMAQQGLEKVNVKEAVEKLVKSEIRKRLK